MSDRIQVLIAVPVDTALPLDVQGVGLRRRAIDLMQEVANIDENTVRYDAAMDNGTIDFGGDVGLVSLWQRNLIGVRFHADGEALKGVVVPVVHGDNFSSTYSKANVVRDEYAA